LKRLFEVGALDADEKMRSFGENGGLSAEAGGFGGCLRDSDLSFADLPQARGGSLKGKREEGDENDGDGDKRPFVLLNERPFARDDELDIFEDAPDRCVILPIVVAGALAIGGGQRHRRHGKDEQEIRQQADEAPQHSLPPAGRSPSKCIRLLRGRQTGRRLAARPAASG